MVQLNRLCVSLLLGSALVSSFGSAATGEKQSNFTFSQDSASYSMQPSLRLQFRASTPFDSPPTEKSDFDTPSKNILEINRARLKLKGHAYNEDLKYSVQYDLANNRLLDFEVSKLFDKRFNLKVGQWKVEFSRERVVSSGGQQMMDRSIVNRIFTLDRQPGVAVFGEFDSLGDATINYWAGIYSGAGAGKNNDDNHLMYVGRVEWAPFGTAVGFKASDIKFSEVMALSIGAAYAEHQSAFTRFSSSGGGALEGFNVGVPGQYDIQQYTLDAAMMYKGVSAQAEYHKKEISDIEAPLTAKTIYTGYYAQAGYFLHNAFDWWPQPLELASRYARYDGDIQQTDTYFAETSIALNWFFAGHKNKLTMQMSDFEGSFDRSKASSETRFQLQWDVTF